MNLLPTSNKRLNLLIWLKALRLGPLALTCAGKTDGGGAQVHAVLSVQAFCRRFGFTYLHTPFAQIEHTSSPDEVARWESTFALGEGHADTESHGVPVVSVKNYTAKPALWVKPVVVALPHAHDYADKSQEDYNWYRDNKSHGRAVGPVRMALHVRRGDVTPTHNADRYTPDAKILAMLDLVLSHIPDQQPEIHLYSQGRADDFAAFAARGCILHLDEDALSDLAGLASADILIIGKSSFSYVAGLLSQGLVIYEPFWHRAGANWIAMNDDVQLQARIAAMRVNTAPNPSTRSFIVTGILRNAARTIRADIERLATALAGNQVKWFLVESDSQDATVATLEELSTELKDFRFVTLGALQETIPDRLTRITHCRNLCAQVIRTEPAYAEAEFVLVADLDEINTLINKKSIESCFARDDWDVVTANQDGPYYDIFALRHSAWSPNDCWDQFRFLVAHGVRRKKAGLAALHARMIRIPVDSDWIEVDSAFGGLAIYRKHLFGTTRYDCVNDKGGTVCEHVPFNLGLGAMGARIFINPALINSGYNEHTRNLKLSRRILRVPNNIIRAVLKPFRSLSHPR